MNVKGLSESARFGMLHDKGTWATQDSQEDRGMWKPNNDGLQVLN